MPDMTLTLSGNERADGTHHMTCADLPGFHFILAPGEAPESMLPSLMLFMKHYYLARTQQLINAKPVLRPHHQAPIIGRKPASLEMELCWA